MLILKGQVKEGIIHIYRFVYSLAHCRHSLTGISSVVVIPLAKKSGHYLDSRMAKNKRGRGRKGWGGMEPCSKFTWTSALVPVYFRAPNARGLRGQ